MRTVTVNLYKVNELSKEAQEKAYNEWLYNHDYVWSNENEATLRAFEKIFPVKVSHWEYNGWHGYVSFEFTEWEEIEDLSGIRLMKYIYNNYWNDITVGRYYSTPIKWVDGKAQYKDRRSKVMIVEPGTGACPLTGYYMDEEILDPIFEFLKNPKEDVTFYDLMQRCFDAWVDACCDDFRNSMSMEAFLEDAEANDMEFYEDGSAA